MRNLGGGVCICLGALFSMWLCACSFSSGVDNPNAFITCKRASECPQGYACRLEVGRCLRLDATDYMPPSVQSPVVQPARIRRDGASHITFTASEPLLETPKLQVRSGAISRDLPMEVVSQGETPQFSVLLQPEPGDVEGVYELRVDLTDASGNVLKAALVGAVTFDFTPPTATVAELTPAPVGNLTTVRATDTLLVRLQASEPVQSSTMRLVGRNPACSAFDEPLELVSNANGYLDFRHAGPAGPDGCALQLVLKGLTDLAGNDTADLVFDTRYRVDGVGPAVRQLKTWRPDGGAATEFSRQPGFSTMVVTFEVDESAARVEAHLGAGLMSGCTTVEQACAPADAGSRLCRCTTTFTAATAEPEGPLALAVTTEDSAHNFVTASTLVTLDYTPPTPAGRAELTFIPLAGNPLSADLVQALGPKSSVTLFLVMSEPTVAVPSLQHPTVAFDPGVAAGGAGFFYSSSVVQPNQVDGCAPLTVTAADRVGNQATSSVMLSSSPCGLRSDWNTPALPDVKTLGRIRLSRVPWGARSTNFQPASWIDGTPGSVSNDGYVEILHPVTLQVMAAQRVDAGLGFGPLPVPVDVIGALVRLVDFAGNATAPTRVLDHTLTYTNGPFDAGQPLGELMMTPDEAEPVTTGSQRWVFDSDSGVALAGTYAFTDTTPQYDQFGLTLPGESFSRIAFAPLEGAPLGYPGYLCQNPFIAGGTCSSADGYGVLRTNGTPRTNPLVTPATVNAGPLEANTFELVGGTTFGTNLLLVETSLVGPRYRLLNYATGKATVQMGIDAGPGLNRAMSSLFDPVRARAVIVARGGTWTIERDGGVQVIEVADPMLGPHMRIVDGGLAPEQAAALAYLSGTGQYLLVNTRPDPTSTGFKPAVGFDTWISPSLPSSAVWSRVDGGSVSIAIPSGVNTRPCLVEDAVRGGLLLMLPGGTTFEWTGSAWVRRYPSLPVVSACSAVSMPDQTLVMGDVYGPAVLNPQVFAAMGSVAMHSSSPKFRVNLSSSNIAKQLPAATQVRVMGELGATSFQDQLDGGWSPVTGGVLSGTVGNSFFSVTAPDAGPQNTRVVQVALDGGMSGTSLGVNFAPLGTNGRGQAQLRVNYVQIDVDYRVKTDGGL